MITNKDIRIENGNIILNGDKYPLDGQSPEAIMAIVEDNSDTTPTENSTAPITSGGVFAADKDISDTIGDITQTGLTGNSVAEQLTQLNAEIDVINSKLTRVELNITSLDASSWTESSVSGLYFTHIALPAKYYGRNLISATLRRKYSGDNYIFIGNYNNFGTNDKVITIFSVTNNPRAISLDLYYEAAQNN